MSIEKTILFDKEYEDGHIETAAFTPEEIAAEAPEIVHSEDAQNKVIEALTAVIINLQRDFDAFKNRVARAFKEIGHEPLGRSLLGE